MVDVEFVIGNDVQSVFGTNGIGIFVLQEILSKDVSKGSLFGYSSEFVGAGVFLNTGLRKRDPANGDRVEGVQGKVSDGSQTVNTWDIPNDDTCYFHYREHTEANTLRLHYKNKIIDVFYFDKAKSEFMPCFNLEVDLTAGGYLALSGSSGVWDEDFHVVKSIKTMNPNKVDKSHHSEEAKKMKGQKYLETLKSTQDIMHKNRLKYTDMKDLIGKVNKEISKFMAQTEILQGVVREEITHTVKDPQGNTQTVDIEKINEDSRHIMRDLTILNRMMNYTFDKIDYLEQIMK